MAHLAAAHCSIIWYYLYSVAAQYSAMWCVRFRQQMPHTLANNISSFFGDSLTWLCLINFWVWLYADAIAQHANIFDLVMALEFTRFFVQKYREHRKERVAGRPLSEKGREKLNPWLGDQCFMMLHALLCIVWTGHHLGSMNPRFWLDAPSLRFTHPIEPIQLPVVYDMLVITSYAVEIL